MKGRTHITNHLREILENATKEVIICLNANEMKSKMKLFEQTFEALRKSNIKIKVALSGDEEMIKKMSEILKVKISRIDIDTKFFIVDRKEILFYLLKENKDSNDEDIAIWLNSEFFASAFTSLFERATFIFMLAFLRASKVCSKSFIFDFISFALRQTMTSFVAFSSISLRWFVMCVFPFNARDKSSLFIGFIPPL